MDGDRSYSERFAAEYPSVLRTIRVIVGDGEVAREVTQEAFVQLFIHWRKVSGYDRPGAWVRRVAIRLAVRERARAARLPMSGLDGGGEPADGVASGLDLAQALRLLPACQRAAIVLHYLDDLPVRAVADALGCRESTAKVHLHRGRARLAALLREESHDEH